VNGRRPLALAILGCLAGGALILLAAGRVWARTTLHAAASGGVSRLTVHGHNVAPALPALGIALLALGLAVLAARGVLRRIVGLIVVVLAGADCGLAVTSRSDASSALEHQEVGAAGIAVHASANGWWVVALLGGVIAVVAGAAVAIRGERWAAMSSRYDAPAASTESSSEPPTESGTAEDPAAAAWAALDRGEDPTA
jgi:uncharacterized membrane protein (TIGR02234 family)